MRYTLVKQYNEQHVHITFDGNLAGQPVLWDTDIFTAREHYKTKHTMKNIFPFTVRQIIDISEPENNKAKLLLTLHVKKIDIPTIQKSIIMIQQYKKLSPGRHEHGDTVTYSE